MADIEISVDAGTSKRLLTAGKYCDKNILVSASGGAATPVIEPLEVTTNGTYTAPDGVDGYSPVTVNVSGSNELVTVNFYINTMSLRKPSLPPQCQYIQNRELKTQSGGGAIQVDKNSILHIYDELGQDIFFTGESERLDGVYGNNGTFYIFGECYFEREQSGGGSADLISDTQALNIITGGEEV